MRLRNFVLIIAIMVLPFGLAYGQSISLDHTDGLIDATHLDTGVPVTFHIRITGDNSTYGGITNAFRAYSDDGAVWNPMVGDTVGLGKALFDGGFFISPFSLTGSGADTIGFGGFVFFGAGLPAGYDDIAYTLDIGPIAATEIGKTICLDSSFYPPTGFWVWDPAVLPSWDGPHCFTIGPPAECAVAITAPAGGETWTAGTMQNITYATTDCADCGTVDIFYSADGGPFTAISTGSTNTGTLSWMVPDIVSGNVVVQVCCNGTSDCAVSNAFTIEAAPVPEIVSVDPNTGAQSEEGLVITITGADTDWQSVPVVSLTHNSGSPTIIASSVVLTSTTEMQATFSFPHDAPTGLYYLTVGQDVLVDGFTVTTPPNNPPVIADLGTFNVCADSLLEILVSATDSDQNPLTLLVETLAPNMTFYDSANGYGVLSFTPDMTQVGVFELIAHASDGIDVDLVSFTITVEDCTPPCVEMSLSQTEFVFTMTTADGVNPDPQYLTILSSGTPFGFDIIKGTASWLTISPLNGMAGDAAAVSVDGLSLNVGTYDVECAVVDNSDVVCDPNTQYFTVTLNVTIPPSDDDVISIPTVPAVLGSRVAVPISMEFMCDLAELNVWLEFPANETVLLDSISFVGSLIESWANKNVALGTGDLNLTAAVSAGENLIPAATGLLMTLHINVLGNASSGFYPINGITPSPIFTYDCGAGPASVVPTIISGGIIVGSSENYVCGYVVDPDGHSIEGATVELWADFPYDTWDDQTHSDITGLFEFFNSTVIPFDLYAYKEGYYPGKLENINFAHTGIMIVLTPVQPITPTQEWVNFYCEDNLYMGAALPIGSVIDAFDPDGIHCGSWFVSEAGRYGFMPIYGDDLYTTEDEGADPGDNIRFYVNGVQAYTPDPTEWTGNGDVHQVCLDVGDIIVKTCDLFKGWNLVSWNVDHENDDINEVLASIEPCLEVILGFDGEGLIYNPAMPMFSNLKFVDHLSGYWIKVSCDITLEISGEAVPVTTGIPLIGGWNLVSYLPDYSLPTEVALASIHDDLIVALGWDPSIGGLQYQPGDFLHNNLLEMGPCNGYWIKNDLLGVLTYPGAGPKIAPQPNQHFFTAKGLSDDITATNTWMNVYAQNLTIDGATVKAGTQVTAHNEDGLMIGRFVIEQDGLFGFMAVYGDDQTTTTIDGARQGETFTLRIDGVETHEIFTFNGATGSQMEVGALTAKGNSDANLPTKYSLGQNYPNPFNPKTTISFVMPTSGKATIEIYNVLGRLVSTPFDDIAQSGVNEVAWDGTNSTGETVASGIYFYRLKTEGFVETKKMTLLK